ncbi:MAG: GNAT family N-acetyltransferase [Deltaproteobacteria bacterium]|jgi:putative acetyltransferase|nr:GNAT family N-acetyltransferase [Deltaproteobacteria bacterium]
MTSPVPAAPDLHITQESPLGADLGALFARHAAHCRAQTPPGSVHMRGAEALDSPDVAFFVLRAGGAPLAMGALRILDPHHGELKSMHVLDGHRGRGLAQALLARLVAEAQRRGLRHLSLETGAQPNFDAARALYRAAGFVECEPFGDYTVDPSSVYMTLELGVGQ